MYSTILVIAKTFGQSFFAMFGKQWKQTKPRCFIFFGMLILTISHHGVVSFAAARGPKSLKGDQPSRFCGCLKGIHQRINTVPVIHRSRHEYSRKSFSFGVRRRYGSLLINLVNKKPLLDAQIFTPCGHTFCGKSVDHLKGTSRLVPCPLCRQIGIVGISL